VSLTENSIAGAERRKDRTGGPDGCAGRGHGDARPGLGQLRRLDRATQPRGCAGTRPPGLSYRPATARARTTVSADNPEAAASVTIGVLGYRARCIEPACGNRARLGLRYAAAGGRPIGNAEFCYAHARRRLARDRRHSIQTNQNRSSAVPCDTAGFGCNSGALR